MWIMFALFLLFVASALIEFLWGFDVTDSISPQEVQRELLAHETRTGMARANNPW